MIELILVPQGAEYTAVCQGLRGVEHPPAVFPIAAGPAVERSLEQLHQNGQLVNGQTALILGLCGGLVPDLAVGDAVIYQTCQSVSPTHSPSELFTCDRALMIQLQHHLGPSVPLVRAVTSDRVISSVEEKRLVSQQGSAQVVDMEGTIALRILTELGVSVATLRIVSDDCQHPIPNLTNTFDPDGNLKPLALTAALLRQPLPAFYLIRGALTSLKILRTMTADLFKNQYR